MIRLHYQYPAFRMRDASKVKNWLEKVAKNEKKRIGEIDYIFLSDKELLFINQNSLGHDYYTDIITFPHTYSPIHTEIYISIDRIKAQSKEYSVSFVSELRRVMVHGLLHMCGYDDKSKLKKKRMTEREDYWLGKWD